MSQGSLFGDTRTDKQKEKDRSKAHTCHAIGCGKHCKPINLMCYYHWSMVPIQLKKGVWSTYREGQCNLDPMPSREWFKAADKAIKSVAKQEGITFIVNLRKKPYDVYIGRRGKGKDGYFGNPFPVSKHGEEAMALFEDYFHKRVANDPEFKSRVLSLKGKVLGCFCKPRKCHGDIITRWLNNNENK